MVVLERKRLTSGTTWHAAGLITQARPTYGTREIVRRSLRIFSSLQEETGFATGFEMTGTLHLADSAERLEELLRQASAARSNGITAEAISPEQAVELFPPLYAGDLAGAVYYPDDGRGNATDTTMALAAGARQHGVRIVENTKVTGVTRRDGRVTGVTTEHGDIEAEYVVAATGMWGREFGALAGVGIPLQALAHYYVITEPIPAFLPACRRSRPPRTTRTCGTRAPGSWSASSSRAAIPGPRAASRPTRSSPACPRTGITSGRSTRT